MAALALPTRDELDLADHKLDAGVDDLDIFIARLRDAWPEEPASLVEYEARRITGDTFEVAQFDRGDLAELVVFAIHFAETANLLAAKALELQTEALRLIREQRFDWEARRARVREWHLNAVEEAAGDA
jgi:hypothetical protein